MNHNSEDQNQTGSSQSNLNPIQINKDFGASYNLEGISESGSPGKNLLISHSNQQTNDYDNTIASISSQPKLNSNFYTQTRALMLKNMSMQSKMLGTNLCQILTPLLCLIFIVLIKKLAETQVKVVFNYVMNFPYIFNIPYSEIYGLIPNNPINITSCLQWYEFQFDPSADQETIQFIGYNNGSESSGMLSNVQAWGCPNYTQKMPYFQEPPNNLTIDEDIFNDINILNNNTYVRFKDIEGLDILPDGALTFYEANPKNLTFRIQINDLRIPEYHRNNGVTKFNVWEKSQNMSLATLRVPDGQLALLDLISRAYLRTINSSVWIVSGSQYMPISASESSFIIKVINLTGASLYPIALSLLLPVFMYAIVLEKEERLQEMMKMNGMKMANYWLVNYIWNYLIYFFTVLMFYLFGYFILKLSFFTDTNKLLMFIVFNGWGLCQVSMAFFFQNFLGKARTATIAGYLLSVWQSIIAVCFNVGVYPDPLLLPFGMRIYPPFSFCRLMYDLSMQCSNYVCIKKFSSLNEEMIDCIWALYIGAAIFLLIGIYLNEILPAEFGVPRHPLFFLDCFRRKNTKVSENLHYVNLDKQHGTPIGIDIDLSMEDDDSRAERKFVHEISGPYSAYPLIIKDIKKIYKAVGGRPPKLAVKCFSLAIRPGEMFGLLGPNGAGKTTLISILTGLYTPDAGNAWIAGHEIRNQIGLVHKNMGVCPQFDLLWPDLTVKEHLLFYARIRGVRREEEESNVKRAMSEVYLTKFANFKTRQLSGGMKRRLSVAISLVGDPKVVFLDEPTTGLDPENRRQLWDILTESKKRRAMVLTTHSMEEADVLCTRIGIITDGILRCVGSKVRLKTLYGGGYHLYINCHKEKYFKKLILEQMASSNGSMSPEERKDDEKILEDRINIDASLTPEYYHEKIKKYVRELLPKSHLRSEFNGNFIFQIPLEGFEVSKLFDELELKKNSLAIADWGISQSSLEDVFMEIVKTSMNYNDDDIHS